MVEAFHIRVTDGRQLNRNRYSAKFRIPSTNKELQKKSLCVLLSKIKQKHLKTLSNIKTIYLNLKNKNCSNVCFVLQEIVNIFKAFCAAIVNVCLSEVKTLYTIPQNTCKGAKRTSVTFT